MSTFFARAFAFLRSLIGLLIGLASYAFLFLSIFEGISGWNILETLIVLAICIASFVVAHLITHEDFRADLYFSFWGILFILFVYLPFYPIVGIVCFRKGIGYLSLIGEDRNKEKKSEVKKETEEEKEIKQYRRKVFEKVRIGIGFVVMAFAFLLILVSIPEFANDFVLTLITDCAILNIACMLFILIAGKKFRPNLREKRQDKFAQLGSVIFILFFYWYLALYAIVYRLKKMKNPNYKPKHFKKSSKDENDDDEELGAGMGEVKSLVRSLCNEVGEYSSSNSNYYGRIFLITPKFNGKTITLRVRVDIDSRDIRTEADLADFQYSAENYIGTVKERIQRLLDDILAGINELESAQLDGYWKCQAKFTIYVDHKKIQ